MIIKGKRIPNTCGIEEVFEARRLRLGLIKEEDLKTFCLVDIAINQDKILYIEDNESYHTVCLDGNIELDIIDLRAEEEE